MTLREKFRSALPFNNYRDSVKLEKIVDTFSIGFAEWYLDLWNRNDKSFDNNNPKQLLQIYKKEKGL